MINVTDLRAGTGFRLDGQMWVVVKYDHIKMGRGTATIKVKAKNLETGSVLEKSFISGARVEELDTSRRELTFLYYDGDSYVFMDPRTYEQYELGADLLEDAAQYLQAEMIVQVMFVNEDNSLRPLGVMLPPKLSFKVTDAEPGVKGDSAANMLKKVTLENGLEIKAPLFIKVGDVVVVDTRDGSYVERSNR